MAVWYIWITKTLFVENSRQVKVFESRIFGISVRNARKFLFLSNHSIWSIRFSAALGRKQALLTATTVLRAVHAILEIFEANLNIALGVNPFVSSRVSRLNVPSLHERGLNLHWTHLLALPDICNEITTAWTNYCIRLKTAHSLNSTPPRCTLHVQPLLQAQWNDHLN